MGTKIRPHESILIKMNKWLVEKGMLYQLINVEWMMELENHHLVTIIVIPDSGMK